MDENEEMSWIEYVEEEEDFLYDVELEQELRREFYLEEEN